MKTSCPSQSASTSNSNAFSEKDIKIEDIHIPQTSLEDVFLDLTGRKIND